MNENGPRLSSTGCRQRQRVLCQLLHDRGLDAVVTGNRHYVHALTGYWHEQPLTPVAAIVQSDSTTTLVSPGDDPLAPAADAHRGFAADKCCTLIENQVAALADAISPILAALKHVGTTDLCWPWLHPSIHWTDLTTAYQQLRRTKFEDEIELLRFAITAADAVYECARQEVRVGVDEVQLYARLLQRATEALGEPVSGWGQDFQIGSPGGIPRRRRAVAGELAILDIGVGYRGYRCDLCRTFAVSGRLTTPQYDAYRRILGVLDSIESQLQPGVDCQQLYRVAEQMLDGWKGYRFFHHLGHGIGLDAHEAPRLNPNWNDTLQIGDVIAVEPGLYGDELRGGIRLEQNYRITADGSERLSHYPLDLC